MPTLEQPGIAEVKAEYQQRNNIVPEKKLNHQANVVRIDTILPHPDPETTNLELIHIGEYQAFQVVVRKGTFKAGDLGVYIQPDSVVPQTEPFKFIWDTYIGIDGTVPERRRRITVRKFRGEWSEGLLLPLSDFKEVIETSPLVGKPTREGDWFVFFKDGEDVSELLGVTHYDPDAGKEGQTHTVNAPRRRTPKTLKGWFYFLLHKFFGRRSKSYFEDVQLDVPEYDVKGYKNHAGMIQEGEQVVVTEKVHGSNARYVYIDGVMYAGSKTQWKSANSPCDWRKALVDNPWIEEWCKNHPGFALYGEIVPTQKKYDYGTPKGQVKFMLFDIRTPDGLWVPYEDLVSFDDQYEMDAVIYAGFFVPGLYEGPFSKKVLGLVDGPSMVAGANHIREGIVIKPITERRVPGVGRVQLKLVSNSFLEKDNK